MGVFLFKMCKTCTFFYFRRVNGARLLLSISIYRESSGRKKHKNNQTIITSAFYSFAIFDPINKLKNKKKRKKKKKEIEIVCKTVNHLFGK